MVAVVLSALWLSIVPLVVAGMSGPVDREPSQRPPPARAAALPACTIIGTQASETLVGTAGDDVICALGGDDVVRGRGGDDVLFGSFGDDVLEGGPGRDELRGHWGTDRLNGGGGNDRMHGGGDPDVFSGGDGTDIVEYVTRTGPVRVSIGSGGANDGWAGEHDRVRGDVERVGGGAGADRLVGNGKAQPAERPGRQRLPEGRQGRRQAVGRPRRGPARRPRQGRVQGCAGLRAGPAGCGAGERARPGRRQLRGRDAARGRRPGDKNRAPTDVRCRGSSVAENRPAGTVVGTLSADDRGRRRPASVHAGERQRRRRQRRVRDRRRRAANGGRVRLRGQADLLDARPRHRRQRRRVREGADDHGHRRHRVGQQRADGRVAGAGARWPRTSRPGRRSAR